MGYVLHKSHSKVRVLLNGYYVSDLKRYIHRVTLALDGLLVGLKTMAG